MMNNRVMSFLSPVFLTTFFFISGYLFKSGQKFSIVFEHRTRTLLIPFIILGLIMVMMGQILTFNDKVPFTDAVAGLFFQNGQNQILWFIGALFVYSIIYYFVDIVCKTPAMLFIMATALFIVNSVAVQWCGLPYLPWHLSYFGFACFYMALGSLYKLYESKIDGWINRSTLILLIVGYLLYVYLVDAQISYYGSKAIVDSMMLTMAGLVIIITISKRYLHNNRLLMFVGANTMFYFAFHGKVYSALITGLHKVAPAIVNSGDFFTDLLTGACIVLADALILIVPAMIVNRYCPQILGRNFRLYHPKS